MANANGWGDGASNNNIGWGKGADNAIGWGDIHADSYAGLTDIVGIASFDNTKSILLGGIDDYIDCGDSNDFSFGNGTTDSSFSISAWVKMDVTGTFGILNKYGGTSTTSEYLFGFTASNKLQLVLTKSNTLFVYRGRRQNVTLNTGEWYHVLGTYDGRGGNLAQEGIRLYVNGVRVDDTDENYGGGYTAMSNTSTPVLIGKQTLNYSDGNIDEVAVFNTELSASDVTSIYNSGIPNDISSLNPVGWWRCGDGDTSPILTDNGSGGNNGTMTNFTTFSTDVPI